MVRILVVDDEEPIRKLLSMAFTRAGYAVRTAANGPEAIDLFTSEPFDVVLTDVIMPLMNGHELVRWIARRSPSTRTALMSGYDIGCEKCEFARECRFLRKPFRLDAAVSFVGDILADTTDP